MRKTRPTSRAIDLPAETATPGGEGPSRDASQVGHTAAPGRPPGAANHVREVVVEIPPGCPACGATAATVLRIARSEEIAGEIQGRHYTRIVWRRVRCQACGQHYIRRSHECDARRAED